VFAKHLRLLTNFPIRQASLEYTTHAPDNQNIEPPSLLLPGSVCDHFCRFLRYLSQLGSLSVLYIHDAVISPELFWPSDINAGAPFWPNLTILRVSFNMMAADGGWYYERNPHVHPDSDDEDVAPFNPDWESMPPTPERVFAEKEARARDTDFSAGSDVSATDSETENQRRLYDTSDCFRTWPSPKMEALLQAMARAATCMPRLRKFVAGSTFDDCDRGQSVDFEFFYLCAGEQQIVCDARFEHDDVAKRRLLWHVPEFWRMSDAVERLWRQTLGRDGIIEYQEWDD
jgi:hypothetical protein